MNYGGGGLALAPHLRRRVRLLGPRLRRLPHLHPGELHEGSGLVVVASLEASCEAGCPCACHKTGYDFVLWMAESGLWPQHKPAVHSANPVGARNMRAVIERYWRAP